MNRVAPIALTLLTACAMRSSGGSSIPTSVAQTSNTEALLIAVAPVSENVVWASGAQGTYVRTTDGGATWQARRVPGADSLQFRDVHALDANTAWLLSIGNGPQSRIYKTTDGGANWTQQFRNEDPQGFYDCFDFWDDRRGIVIGDAIGGKVQMLYTDDGGQNWRKVDPAAIPAAANGEGSFAASGLCVETQPGGHGWIVASNPTQARVLHTSDYGRTWEAQRLPITTHEGSGPQGISFRDARNGVVLGGGYAALPGDTLTAITSDGGRTWAPRARMPQRTGAWGGLFVRGTNPPAIVAVGPNGAAYSRDQGGTWMAIDTLNYWSVGFASPRAGWAVGARGRITRLSGF